MTAKKHNNVHLKPVVLDSHGVGIHEGDGNEKPSTSCSTDVWYVPEDKMPAWMKTGLESWNWTKGKIHCPKCEARVGSFNFVSGMKCTCGSHLLPPIHIVKSKVDVILPLNPNLIMSSISIN
jgi:hypothetical protein